MYRNGSLLFLLQYTLKIKILLNTDIENYKFLSFEEESNEV